jgi:hypothetical protein
VYFLLVAVPTILALAWMGRKVVLANRIVKAPSKSPVFRSLERFGHPQDIAAEIDNEMLADHQVFGEAHITSRWLIAPVPAPLSVTRLDDIVWAYKHVTQHNVRFYFVVSVPTHKTYTGVVWDRCGACLAVPGDEGTVDQLLQTIVGRTPWAIVGSNYDLQKAWRSDPKSFIAAVGQR